MQVNATSEHVGAEVSDIDLTALGDAEIDQLQDAWADHGVLFFRDQALSPHQHIAFAERLAPIDINKFFAAVDGYPQIAQVLKEPDHTMNIGGAWHTDHSYDQVPAKGSILLAREVPAVGGDTRFLSVGAAYDALSDGLKKTLDGLRAHHSNAHVFGTESEYATSGGDRFGNTTAVGEAIHPVVIRHPRSGRKLLYVNLAFTTHFVGWTVEESRPLLNFLYEHTSQEQFSYQFHWEPGSIAMWDNRSTWHFALNDYAGHRRLMHRITIQGEALV